MELSPPKHGLDEYNRKKLTREYPYLSIVYNAHNSNFFVSIFPLSWTNSLFLKKVL